MPARSLTTGVHPFARDEIPEAWVHGSNVDGAAESERIDVLEADEHSVAGHLVSEAGSVGGRIDRPPQ
jgi:hypothetical protein